MLGKLLLLFTVVPVVELYLLITLGQHMGAGATVALVLSTGLLGAWLAKREGARVLSNWQGSMARGEIPKEGVVSSVLVLVGGVLLVTPGVVTDVTGLLLLWPWTRRLAASVVRKRLQQRFEVKGFMPDPSVFMGMGGPPAGTVIDVDAVEATTVEATTVDVKAREPESEAQGSLAGH